MIEIKNARITSARLIIENGSFLCVWLGLDYGDGCQSFGGWVLHNCATKTREPVNFAGIYIYEILKIAEEDSWDRLVGKTIRAKCRHDKVYEIGHILKNEWFNPEEKFKGLRGEK